MASAEDQVRVRLTIPEPPQPPTYAPRARLPDGGVLDLSLELAAVKREEERAARPPHGVHETDEDIAARLQQEAEAKQERAVNSWSERGFPRDDAIAAVVTCGVDTASQDALAFLEACAKLRDEFGFDAENVRRSLTLAKGDVGDAVNRCLQDAPTQR
mmetsp:Transcript_684/g.1883  ORF Transcript_684/g.1883 Transcript_684/m.1883 type:complete len:158 (+) Transcript_684:122-595(+)